MPRTTSKLDEIGQQIRACHAALVELEKRAGIENGEAIRDEPAHYEHVYDAAEPWSDEQRAAETAEEKFHQDSITRKLRTLYFAVPDVALRKELIAKYREEGTLSLSYWQQELHDAASALVAARLTGQHWWIWASVSGVIIIAVGFHFFGLLGAIGGALVGYLNGRRLEREHLRAREAAVADAEREVKDAEKIWNEVRNEPQMFSQREARNGEPDR
jgi:hypothetical protein